MKKQLITLMLLMLGTLIGHAQYSVLNGDLNHDGKISIEDVTMMTDIILENSPAQTIESETPLSYGEVPVVPDLAESAELLSGTDFNVAIKRLISPFVTSRWDEDYTIKRITFRKGSTTEGIVVSSAESLCEARAVYNAETQEVDIYVNANKLVFPEDCRFMFCEFRSVTQIDWSAFGPNIDTSNVTNMGYMFEICPALTTLDFSNFDTNNVTDMSYMFDACSALTTLDVSHFDTRNVMDMRCMFAGCSALTTLDLSHFDTSNVTNMVCMFSCCSALTTLDVSHFDTSNVTDMSVMFQSCEVLTTLDVSHFVTSNVTDMSVMFSNCYALTTLDVSHFDTSNVTDMSLMFNDCDALTTLDVSHFDTRKVTNMSSMFYACSALTTLDVANFESSNVTNMSYMFAWCQALTTLDVSHFDTSNVTNMYCMFADCQNLTTLDVSHFDISNVTDMSWMFYCCYKLSSLMLGSNFAIAKGCSTVGMLSDTPNDASTPYCTITCAEATQTKLLASTGINESKIRWNILGDESAVLLSGEDFNVAIKRLVYPSAAYSTEDTTIKKITFRKGSTTEGTVVSSASSLGVVRAVYNADTQEVDIYVDANKLVFPGNCRFMFRYFTNVTQIDWSAFGSDVDTSNVTNMGHMFSGCHALTTLDVSNFDTSNVTNMSNMFSGCSVLTTLDVSHFNTSKAKNMGTMFAFCNTLTTLDISHFDTRNVTNMSFMFAGCYALTTLDVSHFDTSNVTVMSGMFSECTALTTLDVSNFDTSNVTDMNWMFDSCYKLSSLKLGSSLTIADGCDTGSMLSGTPSDDDTPYCTITCTAATQAKLLDSSTEIDESKILWDIL